MQAKVSSQVWRYLNLASQIALWGMLSDWTRVQRITAGNVNNRKMISRNISSSLSLTYPSFCKNFPPDLLTGIATLLIRPCVAKPANDGELGDSAIQLAKI